MPRARLIETNYDDFRQLLRDAGKRGGAIAKRDTERWQGYVKAHEINEFGAIAIAKGRFEDPLAVILDIGEDSDGFYVYSESQEVCLRLVFVA